jgi:hypothetical protein
MFYMRKKNAEGSQLPRNLPFPFVGDCFDHPESDLQKMHCISRLAKSTCLDLHASQYPSTSLTSVTVHLQSSCFMETYLSKRNESGR